MKKAHRHKIRRARLKRMGLCPYCGKNPPAKSRKMCRKCLDTSSASAKRYRSTDHGKQAHRQAIKNWFKAHPRERAAYNAEYMESHPEKFKQYRDKSISKLRHEIFDHYGTKCACCKIDEPFLTIDHIKGDGNKHRKLINKNGGKAFYSWLRDQGFPKGFESLCWNCNCGKARWGTCPHKWTKKRRKQWRNSTKS